jgi:hypothetical protein
VPKDIDAAIDTNIAQPLVNAVDAAQEGPMREVMMPCLISRSISNSA